MRHRDCHPNNHCNLESCPAKAAAYARAKFRAADWNQLFVMETSGGLRHYLANRPVHAGEVLYLQAVTEHEDAYGTFLVPTLEFKVARYESRHYQTAGRQGLTGYLFALVAGYEFSMQIAPSMRFRWPGDGQ